MAATGTPTPNLGLRIPIGTDPASVDDINYNSNLLDTKLGAVGSDSVQDQIDTLNGNIATLNDKFNWTNMGSVASSVQTAVPSGAKEIIIQGAKTNNFSTWETCSIHLPMLTVSQNSSISAYGGVVMVVFISAAGVVQIVSGASSNVGYYRVFWR